ncbi:enoyl-CoA hydratase/isomerase family protein [Pseudomonas asiatica]|uniref:enoyl-CoA hydratase/isomerase family protein n=1 Tax=Pseudomonas asiatica TaxID=2219225 RepID=UPI002E7C44D6|nr:enoyl-CoA hydratase/isomerase family protein [Pseudomonas asiatica]MEE1916323.1 enoyl-CoA hydratase/isomerase family protein [Pseudomonas asiatica]
MEYTTLLFNVSPDGVGTITLNRPEAMNAFTLTMLREFDHLWAHIRENEDVRAVVLRGSPGRAFSTGADVKQHATENVLGTDNIWNQRDPGESLGARANQVWKPVVTAVHGLCCAGAFYWLNESDIIICSEDAQFFDPHVSYGMVCAVEPIGMSYRLPLGEVLRMSLLGNDERISASTALRIGLVSEITANDALWDRAHELAARIAAKPAAAVQGTVRAIWESLDVPRSQAIVQSLKYPLLGNPVAQAQLDVESLRKQQKIFEVR